MWKLLLIQCSPSGLPCSSLCSTGKSKTTDSKLLLAAPAEGMGVKFAMCRFCLCALKKKFCHDKRRNATLHPESLKCPLIAFTHSSFNGRDRLHMLRNGCRCRRTDCCDAAVFVIIVSDLYLMKGINLNSVTRCLHISRIIMEALRSYANSHIYAVSHIAVFHHNTVNLTGLSLLTVHIFLCFLLPSWTWLIRRKGRKREREMNLKNADSSQVLIKDFLSLLWIPPLCLTHCLISPTALSEHLTSHGSYACVGLHFYYATTHPPAKWH